MTSSCRDPVWDLATRLVHKQQNKLSRSATLGPEQIHSLRVTTKKLRALLRLYYPALKPNQRQAIKQLDRRIKSVADELSDSRDATVLYQTLTEVIQRNTESMSPGLHALLNYFLSGDTEQVSSPSFQAVKQLNDIADRWQSAVSTIDAVDIHRGLDFSYLKARQLAQKALTGHDDHPYHQCRKWVKFYTYQLQQTAPKSAKAPTKYLRKLRKLGDRLGHLHDLCQLQLALLSLSPEDSAAVTESPRQQALAWIGSRKDQTRHKCQQELVALFGKKSRPAARRKR